MHRARTAVAVVVAILVVGWLARTPVTDADLGRVPTEPVGSAEPSADPATSPDEAPVQVVALDPTTLQVTDPGVATLADGWVASTGGPSLLLADPVGDSGRLRQVGADRAADGWPTSRIDRPADLVWLGGADGTIAWIRQDGFVRVQVDGSAAANRTMSLPPGTRVRDARMVDGSRLAILTEASVDAPPSLLVLDVDAHVIALDRALDVVVRPTPRLSHAWDLATGRLHLAEGVREQLISVDLRSGDQTVVDLPAPDRVADVPSSPLTPSLAVGHGLVAVSGTVEVRLRGGRGDTVDRPYGIVLFDTDLSRVARDDDGSTTQVHPTADDRVLALSAAGGASFRDADLDAEPQQVLDGLTVVEVLSSAQGSVTYAVTCPDVLDGCTSAEVTDLALAGRQLVALDGQTGRRVGIRSLDEGFEAFLPEAALLITRP